MGVKEREGGVAVRERVRWEEWRVVGGWAGLPGHSKGGEGVLVGYIVGGRHQQRGRKG